MTDKIKMAGFMGVDDARCFPEDYDHENGMYSNSCHHCNNMFIGYKRRMTCKLCEQENEELEAVELQLPPISIKQVPELIHYDSTDVPTFTFGSGNFGVSTAVSDCGTVTGIGIYVLPKTEIIGNGSDEYDDGTPPVLRLVSTSVESLDVLINRLKDARKELIRSQKHSIPLELLVSVVDDLPEGDVDE